MESIFSFDFFQMVSSITLFGIAVFILVYKKVIQTRMKKGTLKGLNLIEVTSGIVIVNFRKENRAWRLNINSLLSIDQKIDEEIKANSIEATLENKDLVFMLGCFLGEILRNSAGAKWIVEKKEEVPVMMKLKNNEIIMPFEKIKKRILHGESEKIYDYGYIIKHGH